METKRLGRNRGDTHTMKKISINKQRVNIYNFYQEDELVAICLLAERSSTSTEYQKYQFLVHPLRHVDIERWYKHRMYRSIFLSIDDAVNIFEEFMNKVGIFKDEKRSPDPSRMLSISYNQA